LRYGAAGKYLGEAGFRYNLNKTPKELEAEGKLPHRPFGVMLNL
jgi:hypothetical protein